MSSGTFCAQDMLSDVRVIGNLTHTDSTAGTL